MGQNKKPQKNHIVAKGLTRRQALLAAGLAGAGLVWPVSGRAQVVPGLPGMPGLPGADPGKALTDKLTHVLMEQRKKNQEQRKGPAGKDQKPPRPSRKRHPITLAPLPYAASALAPHLSTASLSFHHNKVASANLAETLRLVQRTRFEKWDLDQVVRQAYESGEDALFNQAAELFNHNFFFQCLKPNGGGKPPDKLADFLAKRYGDFERFKKAFIATALSLFGSGWVWVYEYQGQPRLQAAPGALTPQAFGLKPLLALDMWEHAYYLDFQNDREKYAATFLEHLANWDFAAGNL